MVSSERSPPKLQTQLNGNPEEEDDGDIVSSPGKEPDLPGSPDGHRKMAPYPWKQLLVLACCRFSEPVAMTSSFPYLFFMIRDFHLTDDEKQIARYAGLLASCFSFAQFFSGTLFPPLWDMG